MKRHLLTGIAVVLMVLALLLPTSAFADGDEAAIGETPYATLSEAIAAAQAGETVTLLKDVTAPNQSYSGTEIADSGCIMVTNQNAITIDLAGFSISGTNTAPARES